MRLRMQQILAAGTDAFDRRLIRKNQARVPPSCFRKFCSLLLGIKRKKSPRGAGRRVICSRSHRNLTKQPSTWSTLAGYSASYWNELSSFAAVRAPQGLDETGVHF